MLWVGGALLLALNLTNIRQVLEAGGPVDWNTYVLAGQRAWAGDPIYFVNGIGRDFGFAYSPLLAYLFGILPASYLLWAGLHVAAAAAMPRPLGLLALLTFPWWWDTISGSVLTFVVLFAAWAIRGKGWAIALTIVAALLMPRPLVLPLLAWLLWRYPAWRLRFVAIALVMGLATLATGQAFDWLAIVTRNSADMTHEWNMGPSQVLGYAWVPIGVALSILLLRRGYVGLACLAASPYLLPYYLLFGVIDLAGVRRWDDQRRAGAGGAGADAPRPAVAPTL